MYFKKWNRSTYHILHYRESGTAPPPCGVKADEYDLRKYRAGEPTPHIVAEIPPGGTLCKLCEAGTHKRTYKSGL
jgi:hypothetical protein